MIVFLTILKWIGLVLAALIGLVVFVAALVFFVPVRYRLAVECGEKFLYSFRFSYLYPLFYMKKDINGSEIRFYILGMPIRSRPRRKEKTRAPAVSAKDASGAHSVKRLEKDDRDGSRQEGKAAGKGKKSRAEGKGREKKRFSFGRVSSIINIIREKETRSAVRKLIREFRALLCYLSPKRARLDFRIGTGDPQTTGLLIGAVSLMPWAYARGVRIVPDFEEKVMRGRGEIRGRMRVFYFIRLIIRVYRDEELRRVWNRINKKEAV